MFGGRPPLPDVSVTTIVPFWAFVDVVGDRHGEVPAAAGATARQEVRRRDPVAAGVQHLHDHGGLEHVGRSRHPNASTRGVRRSPGCGRRSRAARRAKCARVMWAGTGTPPIDVTAAARDLEGDRVHVGKLRRGERELRKAHANPLLRGRGGERLTEVDRRDAARHGRAQELRAGRHRGLDARGRLGRVRAVEQGANRRPHGEARRRRRALGVPQPRRALEPHADARRGVGDRMVRARARCAARPGQAARRPRAARRPGVRSRLSHYRTAPLRPVPWSSNLPARCRSSS